MDLGEYGDKGTDCVTQGDGCNLQRIEHVLTQGWAERAA